MSQKPPLVISTGNIRLRGTNVLDITVKSSGDSLGAILAPTWDMVGGHKRQNNPDDERWQNYEPLTDEAYTEAYYALLRKRYKENREAFMKIIELEQVTLTCYCSGEGFCHRHLASEVISKIAESLGYQVAELGEVDQLTIDGQFKLI